ncbi:MAG: hypothetical protein GF320_22815 [Armatimonadia bacterium]|nr:hypothetical protein [Armatimonadia bacterium]
MRSPRIFAVLAVAALALSLGMVVGCAPGGGGTTTLAVALSLGQSSVTVGNTTTATATITAGGTPSSGETVNFSSSDTSVATVTASDTTDASGEATATVTAVAAGTATITATSGGTSDTTTVTVTAAGTTNVSISLGTTTVTAGGSTPATATVQLNGSAQQGETVTFSSSDTGVATLSSTSATTDASGQAQVTVNAVAAGTADITATSGGSSATEGLTVQAAAVSQALFFNDTATQFEIVENTTGATPTTVDLGGIFVVWGAQRNGSHVFLTNASRMDPQIRDMATGTNTAFSPTNFSLFSASVGSEVAAISPNGQTVVWIRQTGGSRQIVRADADGSNEQVLVDGGGLAAESAKRVSISPDGNSVGYVTDATTVRRIPITGGTSVLLNLNGSAGADALDWLDNDNLVVSVSAALTTGLPGLIRVPANGDPASILFNDAGTGLRSPPFSVTVDSQDRVFFDEADASVTQTEIYRVDPDGAGTRTGIVTRAADDRHVYLLEF